YVDLGADANGAWDAGAARQALDRLEPVDLEYIEQPLPAAELSETARLRSATDVPIALDESLATHSVETVLTADAADIIVLKPMALGGPDRAVDVARRAREAGVEPVVTTTIDAVVARTAAVHVAGAIPDVAACGLATSGLLADDLAPDPCPVADGRIAVPDGPGLAGDAFRDLL
ncbi:mandelate racemase/muconate lactonizing enzyme family protein, partial [Halorubrum tibetense]